MKTLYESILDDEDVLISNAIKDTNNPFQFVSALINDGDLLIYHKQEIEKLFSKIIKTIKSKSPIELIIQPRRVTIQLQRYDSDPLIIVRPGSLWPKNNDPYGFPGDQQIVVFFTELFMEDYVSYGFKNEKQYFDWIHEFTKKYNLKQSKKDELVYYL